MSESPRIRNLFTSAHCWMLCHSSLESCDISGSTSACVQMKGERDKVSPYGAAVRALVFETHGRGGDGTSLRDSVTAAANGQCIPSAVGRGIQLVRLVIREADMCLRALGTRVAITREHHLLQVEAS